MSGTLKVTTLQDGASATANLTLDSSGNTTAGGTVAMASSFKRNRIINGNMLIDQRNAGASVTVASGNPLYNTVDRWYFQTTQASKFTAQQNAGSVTPPTGFANYLGITSSSAYTVLSSDYFNCGQWIEGYNSADFAWGSASAATVTLSFWVRSSLTGSFGGCIGTARFYPFSYNISSANTWEYKTITIPGSTAGTWNTTNGTGVLVLFSLGSGSTYTGTANVWSSTAYLAPTGSTSVVGTSGATWYVTGVQLEVGTVATPYERQIYSDQLAQCQRYYYSSYGIGVVPGTATNNNMVVLVGGQGSAQFPVQMRTSPTIASWDGAGNANKLSQKTGAATYTANITPTTAVGVGIIGNTSFESGVTGTTINVYYGFQYTASAEL